MRRLWAQVLWFRQEHCQVADLSHVSHLMPRHHAAHVQQREASAAWIGDDTVPLVLAPAVQQVDRAPAHASKVLRLVGIVEVGLAVWVLSGRRPRAAAAAQTALLGAMNGGGLLFSRGAIAAPAAMVTQNLALVALIWSTARR